MVVWISNGSPGTDSDFRSVQGQRYGSDGLPTGSQFQVNSFTTGFQDQPAVAADHDGDFVVVWKSDGSVGSDSSYGSVQGQRYGSDGLPVDGQFQVNTHTTSGQYLPSVAIDPTGAFVVAWSSYGSSGSDSDLSSVQSQRYGSDGSPIGGEFQVNSYTTDLQYRPSVAVGPTGAFLVVWESKGSSSTDLSGFSIQGQRYDSDGLAVGTEFQVNTYTTAYQRRPSAAADPVGGFVVVWDSYGSSGTDASGYSIQGQRYASDGLPLGDEVQINTYTTGWQYRPSVAIDSSCDFTVAWASNGSSGTDSSGYSIQGQSYGSDGLPLGDEFQVNSYTTSYQLLPSVAVDQDSGFLVVWHSGGSSGTDSDFSSIQGQRFVDPQWIFTDGFESGDTGAWTATTQHSPGLANLSADRRVDTGPEDLTAPHLPHLR